MNDKLYQEYIEVSDKIKSLEGQKKILQEQVMKKFQLEKVEKIEAPNGLITIATRSTWVYSDAFKEVIRGLQKNEQKTGDAVQKESEFLRVTLR